MCTFGRESLFRPREIKEGIGHIGQEFERNIKDVIIIRVMMDAVGILDIDFHAYEAGGIAIVHEG